VFGLLVAPFGWITLSWRHLSLFCAAGAISVAALLCVNRSLKLAPASTVVPYQYSMIVWAVMFGYIVFGDVPQLTTALGAVVIIGAGIYIFLRERDLGRAETVVSPPA
jgi:drug/metabolite transporter (DMT)-like permease